MLTKLSKSVIFLCGQGGVGKESVAYSLKMFGVQPYLVKPLHIRKYILSLLPAVYSTGTKYYPGSNFFSILYDQLLLEVVSKAERTMHSSLVTELRFFYEHPEMLVKPIWKDISKSIFLNTLKSCSLKNNCILIFLRASESEILKRRKIKLKKYHIKITDSTKQLLEPSRIRKSFELEISTYIKVCSLIHQNQILIDTTSLTSNQTAKKILNILN